MDNVLQKKYKNNSFINVVLYIFMITIAVYDGYNTQKLLMPIVYGSLFGFLLIGEIKAIITKNYSKRLFLSRNN